MANNIKSKEIIAGFKDDFLNIVEEYSQFSADLRLEKFFIFWNDNHLDHLFANRFDPRELSEAIIKMNQALVEVLSDEVTYSFTTTQRVVALYFILCLFVKQPDRFKRTVRLTCEDAICIKKFANDHQQVYLDLNFVWNELRIRGAIELVEERQLYGPSLLSKRGLKDEGSLTSKQTNVASESKKFLETKIEPQLEEVHKLYEYYQELKESLKLDDIVSTIDFETRNATLKDDILHANDLIKAYKHSLSNDS